MARQTDLFARYLERVAKAGLRLRQTFLLSAFACAATAGSAQASFRGPDRPVREPVAKRGSPLAAKGGLTAAQLSNRLRDQIRAAGGSSGAYVTDLDARHDGTLIADHARRRLILASNAKLFTTAAFLERFGPERRFATRLWARGHRSGPGDHTLVGSLALVGGGDPALASPAFASAHNLPLTSLEPMAAAVRQAGIYKVKGNIRADPTVFDPRPCLTRRGSPGSTSARCRAWSSTRAGRERCPHRAPRPSRARSCGATSPPPA